MRLTERPEWIEASTLARRSSSLIEELARLLEEGDVGELIELVRGAPRPAGTMAQGVLYRSQLQGRIAWPSERKRAFALAILDRNARVFKEWRLAPSERTLAAVYDVLASMPDGTPFSVVAELLGPAALVTSGNDAVSGENRQYESGRVSIFIQAGRGDVLVACSKQP